MSHGSKTSQGKEGKLLSVVILCPTLKKEISIMNDNYTINGAEWECDLCGTHGNVTLEIVKCECGKRHEILIREW